MQINPQKMNPNYPQNPMQIWHSSQKLDRPQVYGCCSVDQVSSHRDYRELLGSNLSKFARQIKQ